MEAPERVAAAVRDSSMAVVHWPHESPPARGPEAGARDGGSAGAREDVRGAEGAAVHILAGLPGRSRSTSATTVARVPERSSRRHTSRRTNATTRGEREGFAMAALDDLLTWFETGGEVGIYDATNAERGRRDIIRDRCEADGVSVLFVETMCNDPRIIDANIRRNKARV